MARSTFYYRLKEMKASDKYHDLKRIIKDIFERNKYRYGYRRITAELHNRGIKRNHKLVSRLMRECGIKCQIRMKKYRSYRGEIGRIADNILNRNFKSDEPLKKLVTDVTEFKVNGSKVYLSPIMDLYNSEIIAYDISLHPDFDQTMRMLDKAFKIIPDNSDAIIHSDQGWQYRKEKYQNRLEEKGIKQSMSRKGNCLDNSVMENFFGILKSEMFYGHKFNSTMQLIKEIDNYIYYYNNYRIKLKLKGLSPVKYRTQACLT